MERKYDHLRIEQKWQKIWEDRQLFKAEVDHSKPKYYVLDMFPYPSGAGLHVGHVTGYAATDIIARYKRQKGFNVLHPMGWDSFGLPAEQYAIRTGTHPRITTEKNIENYRRQLKSLGFSYDWSREITTSDPHYYKWTQWIFTKLYEKGLAYEADLLVNYCPAMGTVLANEEVENGVSKEGGYPVERRPLRQWVLKITAYAERLLEDLSLLDWPESLKKLQSNWIGKSIGARIYFQEEKTKNEIEVFTTRPDTVFGVSFLILSPEHPLIEIITDPTYKKTVDQYCKQAASKSDLLRTDLSKERSGVFTGAYVHHPIAQKMIPVWIADYVLMNYGSGAIMGVPAHDVRDFEFAKVHELPIQPVIDPGLQTIADIDPKQLRIQVLSGKFCWIGEGTLINSQSDLVSLDGLSVDAAKEKMLSCLEENHLGKKTVHYKLRDWLFSRQRYWGEPFPILHFADGTKRILDMDELPLCPPELIDFKPTDSGDSPLARVPEWVNIFDAKTEKPAKRETNTMPQWAGSCWYYLRFCDPQNAVSPWDKEKEQYWMPVDLYVGGVEHAVLHLLYARFWHKVLFDLQLVSTPEPFQTLRNQGLVTARSFKIPGGGYLSIEEVEERGKDYFQLGTGEKLESHIDKMSKSKLNGVSPDEMIEMYGADSLRLYEMFMGPFDKEKLWNTDAVNGCRRFLNRFYDMIFSDKVVEEESEEALKLGHRLVDIVQRDIESLQFNTAIARMMEFMNAFTLLPLYPKRVLQMVTQILYPFAPHIAEEAWEHLGNTDSITYHPAPIPDPSYLIDTYATFLIQVNGKLRGRWDLPKETDQQTLFDFVKDQPQVVKHLNGEIQQLVFVPGKLLNIVVK